MRVLLHILLVALLALQPVALLASVADDHLQAAAETSHCGGGDHGSCCCDRDTGCTAKQCPVTACTSLTFCPAGDPPGLDLPLVTHLDWRVSFALPDGVPPLLLRPPIKA